MTPELEAKLRNHIQKGNLYAFCNQLFDFIPDPQVCHPWRRAKTRYEYILHRPLHSNKYYLHFRLENTVNKLLKAPRSF